MIKEIKVDCNYCYSQNVLEDEDFWFDPHISSAGFAIEGYITFDFICVHCGEHNSIKYNFERV